MIVFTSETFYAGVKRYDRKSSGYLPQLRLFVYVVEQNYVSIRDEVSKMLNRNKCNVNCPICDEIPNQNIHYEGHIIKYLDTKYTIDRLPMGKVLLGDLEKVGWVVLKCDYGITPNSNVEKHFYYSNNNKYPN